MVTISVSPQRLWHEEVAGGGRHRPENPLIPELTLTAESGDHLGPLALINRTFSREVRHWHHLWVRREQATSPKLLEITVIGQIDSEGRN